MEEEVIGKDMRQYFKVTVCVDTVPHSVPMVWYTAFPTEALMEDVLQTAAKAVLEKVNEELAPWAKKKKDTPSGEQT